MGVSHKGSNYKTKGPYLDLLKFPPLMELGKLIIVFTNASEQLYLKKMP
jgi:hypothetical protein